MSKKDFIAMLSIALKETQETGYWLRLMKESDFVTLAVFNSIHPNIIEIIKIRTSIFKTSRNKISEIQ